MEGAVGNFNTDQRRIRRNRTPVGRRVRVERSARDAYWDRITAGVGLHNCAAVSERDAVIDELAVAHKECRICYVRCAAGGCGRAPQHFILHRNCAAGSLAAHVVAKTCSFNDNLATILMNGAACRAFSRDRIAYELRVENRVAARSRPQCTTADRRIALEYGVGHMRIVTVAVNSRSVCG